MLDSLYGVDTSLRIGAGEALTERIFVLLGRFPL
jgi:hypothetical protein